MMKKLILAVALTLAVGVAQAQAVVLITDPLGASGVVNCGFYVDAAPTATVPTNKVAPTTLSAAQAIQYSMPMGALVCLLDINNISVGTHTAQVTAFSADAVWGESAKSVPVLNFTRPVPTSAPTLLRVTR